jgi:hypothetical protein
MNVYVCVCIVYLVNVANYCARSVCARVNMC